nr:hypothetical protein 88 [bacterium]
MMSKIKRIFMAIIMLAMLLFPSEAFASEIMSAGEVLPSDSLVFTIEEGNNLRKRIEELELKEEKLIHTEDLIEVKDEKIETLEGLMEIKDQQIDEWKALGELYTDRLDKLERRERLNSWKYIGWFAAGVVVSGGAIYLGDKIGDEMEIN